MSGETRETENGTHFEVKLLMTPVVVSNCTANANMPAIPAEVD